MKKLITLALLALVIVPLEARSGEAAAGAPAAQASAPANKQERAAIKQKALEFHRMQKEARQAFRRQMQDARKTFSDSLKTMKPEERKAAKQKFSADMKARREAFKTEQQSKREDFLKANPELAGRWERQHARREEARQRCQKSPEECKDKRADRSDASTKKNGKH